MEVSKYLPQHTRTIAGMSQFFVNSFAKALESESAQGEAAASTMAGHGEGSFSDVKPDRHEFLKGEFHPHRFTRQRHVFLLSPSEEHHARSWWKGHAKVVILPARSPGMISFLRFLCAAFCIIAVQFFSAKC